MRGFRDRDFLVTRETLFFCVVGGLHPKDRVISYLKYVPSMAGRWGNQKTRFRRVMRRYTLPNLLETFAFLQKNYPNYLFHSPDYHITMSAVPKKSIQKHLRPERKLSQLIRTSHPDELQEKVNRLTRLLSEHSNVPLEFWGVTGSILLDIHRPSVSDIDLTVYGLEGSLSVKDTLTETFAVPNSPIRRLKDESLKEWCRRTAKQHSLTFQDAQKICERKWNRGIFEDTPFSIHPIQLETEIEEEYRDKRYYPKGLTTIRALVSDNTNALFLPSSYGIKEVEILEGPQVSDVLEVTSFDSLYSSLAEMGELIEVRGKLELVVDKKHRRRYHRVLVGSSDLPHQYIKVGE